MKALLLVLSLVLAATAQAELTTNATFKVDGVEYKDVTLTYRSPSSVTVTWPDGVATILTIKLPYDLRKFFRFNIDAATRYEETRLAQAKEIAEERAQKERLAKLLASSTIIGGQVIQIVDDGFLFRRKDRTIFVTAPFLQDDLTEGDYLLFHGVQTGKTTYEDTSGASRTVEGWLYVKDYEQPKASTPKPASKPKRKRYRRSGADDYREMGERP